MYVVKCQFEGKTAVGQLEKWGGDGSLDLDDTQFRGEAGAYERHQMERRRLQAKQIHAERRKAWLRKNQALLRVFLSYCSLHGAKGGGVTSVRMELLFLLQESQQVCRRFSLASVCSCLLSSVCFNAFGCVFSGNDSEAASVAPPSPHHPSPAVSQHRTHQNRHRQPRPASRQPHTRHPLHHRSDGGSATPRYTGRPGETHTHFNN